MNLKGKTALITGAGKRIGRTLALRLAGLGCHIVVHYRHSKQEAHETAEAIRKLGVETLLVQADLAVPDEARGAAHQAIEWKGSLPILINSAANFGRTPLDKVQPEDWNFSLDTNLLGPFWLAQEIGPHMVTLGEGKIINIADISWRAPWPTRIPYCVSKAGLVSLTMGLANAFAPEVQVNAIGPGPILFPEDYTQEQRETVIRKTLLKRQGSPEDIADAVEFLCRCDYVTGVFLPVDGGQSVGGA